MRLLAFVLLVALVIACSRGAAPGHAAQHKVASVSSRALAHDPPRMADPPHSFDIPVGFGGALTAGAEPSPEHPAGTVFFDGIGSAGVTLAEWDLASGTPVRRVVLPLDKQGHSVLANGGGSLHFVRGGLDRRTYYLRLSSDLKVLSRTVIDELQGWDANAVASDSRVTAIIGPYPSLDGVASRCFANTYDEHGKLLGHRSLDDDGATQLFASMVHQAAVVDGKVYILMHRHSEDPDDSLHIVEYASDLAPITSSVVPLRRESGPMIIQSLALRAQQGRLIAEVPPLRYEFSADLSDMRELANADQEPLKVADTACEDVVQIGPIRATVCMARGRRPNVIAWDRSDARQ